MGMTDDFLTVEEAAVILRFGNTNAGRQSVRRLIRERELRASKIGKRYLMQRADILAYVNSKETVPMAGGRKFELARAMELNNKD